MLGFFATLGVSVLSRLLVTLALGAVVAGAVWFFWIREPAAEPLELKKRLDWKEEHVRTMVVAQAVEVILEQAPSPGTRNSILLAPFAGDDDRVALRKSIYNALLARGYNHGEIRRLERAVAVTPDPPKAGEPAPPDKGVWQRLKDVVGLGSEDEKKTDKEPELPETLLYIEAKARVAFKTESPKLTLELATAPVEKAKGKIVRSEGVLPLETFEYELTEGTREWWGVRIRAGNAFVRFLLWLGAVAILPWATMFLIRWAASLENNAVAAGVLGVYTVLAASAAWVLLGMNLEGFWTWTLFLAALTVAGLYNFIVCERVSNAFED